MIHRDLKPSNNMLGGTFEEVWVVDWGLVKRLGEDEEHTKEKYIFSGTFIMISDRIWNSRRNTSIHVTEQARGDTINSISEAMFMPWVVFCMSVFVVIKAYIGKSSIDVIANVSTEEYPPLQANRSKMIESSSSWKKPPLRLVEICEKAMEFRPADRYQDASVLADDIQDWLDGKHRMSQAQDLLVRRLQSKKN